MKLVTAYRVSQKRQPNISQLDVKPGVTGGLYLFDRVLTSPECGKQPRHYIESRVSSCQRQFLALPVFGPARRWCVRLTGKYDFLLMFYSDLSSG